MNQPSLKQERLKSIEDEVRHLHPLLKALLPKLAGVQEVEYTHGASEVGADFVLSRKEEVFGETDFVGIIAKVGKIQQDHATVQRQIEECDIERFFNNGKRKIFLNEIWVVSTGQISHGAQRAIHEKYRTRKIKFVDGDRLSNLIDNHLPNFWTDVSLRTGDYLHSVRMENDRLDRSLSLIASKDERFYVDQDIYETEEFDRKRHKPAKRIDLNELITGHNSVILIEGGMGAGKSKLVRNLVDRFTAPQQFLKCNLLPVSLSFRDFVEKFGMSPQRTIEGLVPKDVREEASPETKYLLLLDGADEKDLPPDQLATTIAEAAKAIDVAKMKAVITTRWCDGFEGNRALKSSTKRVELRPLSTNRLIEFIQRLCSKIDLKSRLIEDLKKSSLFRELPKSPIAAILLAQLLNDNSSELPSNLTELYSKYTELSLGRWDIGKGLQTQKEFEALTNILMQIAEHTLENKREALTISEAKGFFSGYLKRRHLGIDSDSLFQKLVSRSEIVAVDTGKDEFRFKHKTFSEFFYARAHMKKPFEVDQRAWNPYWVASFYFYVGLQKDCPEVLRAILDIKPRNETERWTRLINIPNYLLAGFSSPYEVIEEALQVAMAEASELYEDVSSGRIASPFAAFPRMHFLWLVQMIVRKHYGFEFFKKAISSAALTLDSNCTDRKLCAVALFLLSAIGLEFEDKDSFDLLIKNYSRDLPIEVELGIRHETRNWSQRSALLKKLDQRIGRAIKGNPKFSQQIGALYEKPIRALPKPKQ